MYNVVTTHIVAVSEEIDQTLLNSKTENWGNHTTFKVI